MCGYDQLRYSCTAWSIESDAKGKCDNGDDCYDVVVVVDDNDYDNGDDNNYNDNSRYEIRTH